MKLKISLRNNITDFMKAPLEEGLFCFREGRKVGVRVEWNRTERNLCVSILLTLMIGFKWIVEKSLGGK